MTKILTAKIDVTKIEKERLYKGEKGTYLDIVIIPTPNSEFADYMIVQSVSKEEKDKGVKGAILGNAKEIVGTAPTQAAAPTQQEEAEEQDDLPF